jgi:DNA-binding transcriptional ArsR family regulator
MDNVDKRSAPDPELDVDWAPAYELLLSLGSFATPRLHALLDLGPAWVRQVRGQLPADLAARIARKSFASSLKEHHDLLVLLIRVCPGERDTRGFVDWLAGLSAGAAYEALVHRLPESGARLPRDFGSWRDRFVDVLRAWDAAYFAHMDRRILEALRDDAAALRARISSAPVRRLVEEVTNGILIEPSPELRAVTLVPQYHHRPYNTDTSEQGGLLILYPADVLPPPPDTPPPGLVRLTHALSDESRLRILRFLADGPCTLTEVARFAGLTQPTVHHHLVQLRAAGLVRVHFFISSPSRYSLRPHALEQLGQLLGSYLEPAKGEA